MKLSPISWLVIGAAFFFIFIAYGYNTFQPNMYEAGLLDANAKALNDEGDKLPRAKARVEKAKKLVQKVADQWEQVVQVSTPPSNLASGGINLNENAWQLVVDSRQFRDNIQKAVNAQVKKGGVKVITGPQVPFSPESASTILAEFYNYPAIAFPVVIFDLGQIQVSGTYEQIVANMRAYSHMPHYLAVADGLRLEGTSPYLRGTYSLSIIGYIRAGKIFTPVPESAGAEGTSSLAGGPGGFGGLGRAGGGKPKPQGMSLGK